MDFVVTGLQTIASMGPMVMMPIIILILGLIFRVKINVLLKSALLVGIGFAGVNMVINWFVAQVADSVTNMVANWGIQTSIMDVGWPARAAATWAFPPCRNCCLRRSRRERPHADYQDDEDGHGRLLVL
jgi:PTS system galactitol-specific IIC component